MERAGVCPFGGMCLCAHGLDELRPRAPRPMPTYESRPCQAFFSTGGCPYGARCECLH